MNFQLSFIEWLSGALRLIGSEEVSLHVRRRSENVLEASLSSVLNIDETHQGVRKFVLLAIDKAGDVVEYSDVECFCLEYSSQVGVLESFLLSNGTPDERTREALTNHRVRLVAITGGDAVHPPTPETVANLSQVLLGAISVSDIIGRLEELQELAATAERGESAEDLLHSAYMTLLLLFYSELEFFAEGGGGRNTVKVSQSGVESAMAAGYAVQSYSLNGQRMSVFLPDRSDLERGLSLAATAYELSLRVERAGHHGPLAQMVSWVSRQFLSYYLSWVDGRRHELPHKELREEFEVFVGAPYVSTLSSRLHDLTPREQIHFLNLLGQVRARAATGDLLDSLDSMVPKVQEACLKTLADFGTLEDPLRLEPFILSGRDSLRDAALSVIGKMGGDRAAMYLIQLINTQKVPLSESILKAIASTRSVLALGSLILFGVSREEAEPPVLNAVESCLDAVDVDVVRREGARYVSTAALERYVAFLFEAEADSARAAKRLALKLIAMFQLPAGVEYVERALKDESLVTRLSAIRVVPLFPSDRLVRAMTDSLASLPEDYEGRKLVEWVTANTSARLRGEGPAGRIASVAELDLRKAVMDSLAKADTELARVCLEDLSAATSAALSEESRDEEQLGWKNMPLLNSIFKCPGGPTIWVAHATREREADDRTVATLIHDNQFEGSLGVGEAASMLSGGLSMTEGTETEIFEGVVFPCLRGEQPRFPVTAGMGEVVMTKIEDGRMVVKARSDLRDADNIYGEE